MTQTASTAANSADNGLSASQIEDFHRDGLIVLRGFADPALCASMRAVVVEHLAKAIGPAELEAEVKYPGAPESLEAPGGRTIRRLLQAYDRHPVFQAFATSPLLARILQQLIGEPVLMSRAHHNCVMTKQPSFSSLTNWHQDIRYWSFERPELVSVWLALGEEYPENGCLSFIPGSHRMTYQVEQFDAAKFFRPDLPENQALINTHITPRLQAGDVVLFHSLTFHAAHSNRTSEVKLSPVFTYRGQSNPPILGTRSASYPEVPLD